MESKKSESVIGTDAERKVIVKLVKQLLHDRPSDVVPFMYSFLKQVNEGVADPVMPTNLQVAEIKNLRKKYDYLNSMVASDEAVTTESEQSDEESEEEESKKAPAKRSMK